MILASKVQGMISKLQTVQWTRYSSVIILSGFLAILMFGENLKAQWWVIDDHEIVYFIGNDHVLRANEIFNKLFTETEVGNYLHFQRFRPTYYTLRLLECWLWGDNIAMWYAFRIFIFALFIGTFWFVISKKVGITLGGLITLYMATFQYWMDIVGRLGPSEIYGVLGLIFLGIGIYIVYENNKIKGWWSIFIGALICSGAKENFVFLLAPLAYIAWNFYKDRKLNFVRAALVLCAIIWVLWIAYTVFVTTRSLGGDIYENSVGIRAKLYLLIEIIKRFDILALSLLCLLFLLLMVVFEVKKYAVLKHVTAAGIMVFMITLTYISQIFLYNNDWPGETRYDFPGLLAGPLLLATLIFFFQQILVVNRLNKTLLSFNIIMFVFISSLIFLQLPNIHAAQRQSHENVIRTSVFSEKMQQLAQLVTQYPNYTLIIQADDPGWDYEPVFSYIRFLRFYGVKNTVSFLWAGPEPKKIGNKFNHALAVDLRDLSLYGKTPAKLPVSGHDFTPLPDVTNNPDLQCILIIISGPPATNCSITITSHWR